MPGAVLIVDDDPYIRDALSDLLADEGYQVLTARDGREALALLATERPCLVLLDLMMPEMDGVTFLQHLRANIPHRSVPVAVMTAAASQLPPRLGLPVVNKPIEIHSLLELVRQHCEPAARDSDEASAPNRDRDGTDPDDGGFQASA